MALSEEALKEANLQFQAKREIVLLKWKKFHNLRFELGTLGKDPWGRDYSELRDKIKLLEGELRTLRALQSKKTPFVWMTINISPEAVDSNPNFHHGDPWNKTLLRKLEKHAKSKMYKSYMYVIEQRKTTFDPSLNFVGQHVHLLLKRNTNKYCFSQVKRNSKNTWDEWCDSDNPQIFNIHECPERFIKDKVDYMLGLKTGKNKPEKVAVDKVWREHLKIKEFYESDDKFFSEYTS